MGSAAAQETVQTFKLSGVRSGWEGLEPESIAGTQNPTLEMSEVGGQYKIEWENGDGLTHNLVIINGDGDVLHRSDTVSTEGDSTSIEFTATEEMAEYYCEPHPSAMRGQIVVGDQSGGGGDYNTDYPDIKSDYDFGFVTHADGFVGITPSDIEGQVNPEITMTANQEYDAALVYGAERDDLNLAFVDDNDEAVAATGYVNDHGTESDVTFTATSEISAYIAEDASDTYRGPVTVEEAEGPSREEQIASLEEEADFVLDGITEGWGGLAPSSIEGTTNPTLEVEAGQEYTIGWINADGVPHNIAIWNDSDESLQSTENVTTQNQTQTMTFTASAETTQYVCEVHPTTMIGEINVTGLSTETAEPTEEPTEEPTDEPDDSTEEPTETSGPGFGGLSAIAGLGAAGAAAARRMSGSDDEE
ncbi:hypothetical protein JCM30237_03400 [Halolamina litorea]